MSETLQIFPVHNLKHPYEILWQISQFSKDIRTDNAHFFKIYDYFYKKHFLEMSPCLAILIHDR